MAAFTSFDRPALERYLIMFGLGELDKFEPIATGIENSNYFVSLKEKHSNEPLTFVLTITEALQFDEVPFFNDLLGQLYKHKLPVPNPQKTLDGMASTIFCGKPTWLFSKLDGVHPTTINVQHCTAIGSALAELHDAASHVRYTRANPFDPQWVGATLNEVGHRFSKTELELVQDIASQYAALDIETALPRGIIHGDLFTDNVLFSANKLTGIIDFYHACNDFLIQDLAITINDWCKTESCTIDEKLKQAFIDGYESVRPLTMSEVEYLPFFQKVAALRFSLTRMLSGTEDAPLKDPKQFLTILSKLP